MSVKTKITFIIIITLVIGTVIGAMLNRAILHHRISRTFSLRNPQFLVDMYENILQPDTEQSQKIREVINKHAGLFFETRESYQEDMLTISESLQAELEPLLSPEQKKHLENPPFFPRNFRNRRTGFMKPDRQKEFVEQEISELQDKLSLSEDQVAQILEILIKSGRPGPFQGPRMSSELERWSQRIKKREEEKDIAIENILNEEQKRLYQQIKEKRAPQKEPVFPRRPRKRN